MCIRDRNAVIIFRFDSTDEAIEALKNNGFNVLKGEKVYGCLLYTSPSPRDS